MNRCQKCALAVFMYIIVGIPLLHAQATPQGAALPETGYPIPSSDRFRVSLQIAGEYGVDEAENSRLGYEGQGRIGWAIVSLFGRMTDRFSYRIDVNPVNESSPLPACGTPTFFYPNTAQNIGPTVRCDNDGDKRVDDYKFIALDPISQQGPLRQAFIDYEHDWLGVRFGRFILPIGFGWQEVGSFTAKDSTHIQRLDAEASYGVQTTFTKRHADGSPWAAVSAAAIIGENNRNHDYNYFYFIDPSLDSHSAATLVFSGRVRPIPSLEIRAADQYGFSGSKVEYFPNYFADKHNDSIRVLSAEWRPSPYGRVFGELAQYVWGPTETSAQLVGVDTKPINKDGYYVGAEGHYGFQKGLGLTLNFTYEDLSRDDSLIKFLANLGLYHVTMGERERDTTVRFSMDFGAHITTAVYRMWLDNPFTQVSGITAVEGPGAYQGRGDNRWGIVWLAHLP
jgi:hypothetical protein